MAHKDNGVALRIGGTTRLEQTRVRRGIQQYHIALALLDLGCLLSGGHLQGRQYGKWKGRSLGQSAQFLTNPLHFCGCSRFIDNFTPTAPGSFFAWRLVGMCQDRLDAQRSPGDERSFIGIVRLHNSSIVSDGPRESEHTSCHPGGGKQVKLSAIHAMVTHIRLLFRLRGLFQISRTATHGCNFRNAIPSSRICSGGAPQESKPMRSSCKRSESVPEHFHNSLPRSGITK